MNLDFTSEQVILRESAAKFLANECPYDKVRDIEESEEGYSPELWGKMAELGWTGLLFPEAYGGYEGTFIDLMVIQEEIGKALIPSPFFSTIIECGLTILEGGSEDQKADLLTQISEGSVIMALAQFEEEGSLLEQGITMPAEASGDSYTLNGTKLFAQDANIADKLIVAANVAGQGVTLFLVDAKDAGVQITKMPTIAMDNTCEVVLNNVTALDVIGPVGGGWAILEKMAAKAAIAKAAQMVGGARVCIDITADYAKQREQYGKPIGGFQAIQHFMSNMLLAYDTSFSYLYRVACMVDEGDDFETEASVMKAAINENFIYISGRAVQIHGGIGTTREGDIGLFYRRAKSYEFQQGDTQHHYDKIMDNLLA